MFLLHYLFHFIMYSLHQSSADSKHTYFALRKIVFLNFFHNINCFHCIIFFSVTHPSTYIFSPCLIQQLLFFYKKFSAYLLLKTIVLLSQTHPFVPLYRHIYLRHSFLFYILFNSAKSISYTSIYRLLSFTFISGYISHVVNYIFSIIISLFLTHSIVILSIALPGTLLAPIIPFLVLHCAVLVFSQTFHLHSFPTFYINSL